MEPTPPPIAFSPEEKEWLEQHPQIVLGYTDQFPPDVIRDGDGRLSGFAVDYIDEINRHLGGRIQLQIERDWSAVTEKAIRRETDGLALSAPNPVWDQHFIYSHPFNYGFFYFYTRDDDPSPPAELTELEHRRIGYLRGMKKAQQLLKELPPGQLSDFGDNREMVQALLGKRVDVLVMTSDLEWWRRQNSDHSFRSSGVVAESRFPLVASIRNDWPLFQGIFNKALAMIPTETKLRIHSRWLGDLPAPKEQGIYLSDQERAWLDSLNLRRVHVKDRMPLSFVDEQAAVIGIGEDYWALIKAKLGLLETPQPPASFIDALTAVEADKADIFAGIAHTTHREAFARFSEPMDHYPFAVATRTGAAAYITEGEALVGKTVAVCRNCSVYPLLQARYPGIDFWVVSDTPAALRAVAEGKAFAAVDILPALQYQLNAIGSSAVRLAGVIESEYDLRIMVRDELAPLTPLLDRAIAAITPEERLAIQRKWMLRDVIPTVDYGPLWLGGSAALMLLLLILFWNRRLRREVKRRAETEARYRELSDRLGKIADRVPGMVYQFALDPEGRGRFPYSSDGIKAIFGVTPDEVRENADCISHLIHPEDLSGVNAAIQISARNLTPWKMDYRIVGPDGEIRWLRGDAVPERQEGGGALWHGFISDVTEREASSRALSDAMKRLKIAERFSRATIDALSAHICVLDENGIVVTVNRAWREFADANPPAPPNYGIGAYYLGACAADCTDCAELSFCAQLQAVLRNQLNGFSYEYPCHAPGEKRWFFAYVSSFEIDGTMRVVVAHENITQRKLAELDIIEARHAADAANQAKSAFLANMSHELRTPLNAVLGFSQLLLQSRRLPPDLTLQAEKIHRGGDYLLTLINDILDLSKIEAGRIELFPQPIVLRDFLDDVTEMVRFRAEQKGVEFEYEQVGTLPFQVEADPIRLRQVLLNLLGNAAKFTERGHVRLRVEYAEGRLRAAVLDTGPGIDAAHLERIFEPFVQAGDGLPQHEGTGLGLPITRRIIELMQGDLGVESEPGKGSCFHFSVPLAADSLPAPVRQEMPDRPIVGYRRTGAEEGERPLRLLVVDDNEANRAFLRDYLAPLGFDMGESASGEACLALAPELRPDLVLMDIRMPGMDGLETMEALHRTQEFAALPVILVTASVFPEQRAAALVRGGVGCLSKPVRLGELLALLHQHLPLEWEYAADGPIDQGAPKKFDYPVEWLDSLEKAVIYGNAKVLHDLLAERGDAGWGVPETLGSWIGDYQYERILAWIAEQRGPQ